MSWFACMAVWLALLLLDNHVVDEAAEYGDDFENAVCVRYGALLALVLLVLAIVTVCKA